MLRAWLSSVRVGAIARQWGSSEAKYMYEITPYCWKKKSDGLAEKFSTRGNFP
jgi:hypothetical protein